MDKDVSSYGPEDFELLEVTVLRQMLRQHFRHLAKRMDDLAVSTSASKGKKIDDKEPNLNEDIDVEEDADAVTDVRHNGRDDGRDLDSLTSSGTKAPRSAVPPPPAFELTRLIDDFVFMGMFIGNDFLPNLPHLDIADGSLNFMMAVYQELLPEDLGGYLCRRDAIHLNRLELFIQEVARREPLYFQQRAADDKDPRFADDNYRAHYYRVMI